MATIPNPWLDSAWGPSAEPAVAVDTPSPAAAEDIAARTDVLQTVGTTVSVRDEPIPDDTSCINEIFWFVRNKLGDYGRADDFVDLDALEDAIDPVPAFLRQRAAE